MAAPGDSYPHNAERTRKIVESTRGDIRQLNALARGKMSLIFGDRMEYIQATVDRRRLPGRAFSEKAPNYFRRDENHHGRRKERLLPHMDAGNREYYGTHRSKEDTVPGNTRRRTQDRY